MTKRKLDKKRLNSKSIKLNKKVSQNIIREVKNGLLIGLLIFLTIMLVPFIITAEKSHFFKEFKEWFKPTPSPSLFFSPSPSPSPSPLPSPSPIVQYIYLPPPSPVISPSPTPNPALSARVEEIDQRIQVIRGEIFKLNNWKAEIKAMPSGNNLELNWQIIADLKYINQSIDQKQSEINSLNMEKTFILSQL